MWLRPAHESALRPSSSLIMQCTAIHPLRPPGTARPRCLHNSMPKSLGGKGDGANPEQLFGELRKARVMVICSHPNWHSSTCVQLTLIPSMNPSTLRPHRHLPSSLYASIPFPKKLTRCGTSLPNLTPRAPETETGTAFQRSATPRASSRRCSSSRGRRRRSCRRT